MKGAKTPNMWVGNDPDLKFDDPRPLKLLDYWNQKRASRRMPCRADVDPSELKEHLGNLVLIDVEHDPLRLRYRLVGTEITRLMERDNTGRYYDEIYPEELLKKIYQSFEWILSNKSPLRSFGRAFYPDKNYYRYEIINLPLSDNDDKVNMVLGELVFAMANKLNPSGSKEPA